MRPGMSSQILLIVVALFLVVLNGFFVAAEFGLVKLRQTRVQALARQTGWRGQILLKVHQQLDAYLSACQLGITLASLGLGWIGEPAFAALLEPLLVLMGIGSPQLIHGIAFFIAFFTISFLHIVVGELAPKSMAIRLPESIGLWTAPPLYAFYWLMYPAIWLLNNSANLVLRLVGLAPASEHDAHYTADELKLILRTSHANSEGFTDEEWNTLAHMLDFSKLQVGGLMRPFHEVEALSAEEDSHVNLERMLQYRYSRYPYLDENGLVLGIIHLKDVVPALYARQPEQPLEDLQVFLRPPLIVTPDSSAIALFRLFRSGAPHFAIVAWPKQPPVGFITLDNLLAALVGEIRDEFRGGQNDWQRQTDASLLGKGSLPIFTLERALGIEITDEDADSVGGMVMWRLGSLPYEGQKIEFEKFDIVIKKMDGPRIALLQVFPK